MELIRLESGKLLRDVRAPLGKFAGGDFFVAIGHLVAAFERGRIIFSPLLLRRAWISAGVTRLAGMLHRSAKTLRHGPPRRTGRIPSHCHS